MTVKLAGMGILKASLEKRNGEGLEEQLWIFPTPTDAVCGAVNARSAIQKYNLNVQDQDKFVVTGYGIQTGDLLILPGTDIHWGDPVNTSSKLGQDLARDGDILIMPEVKMAAE